MNDTKLRTHGVSLEGELTQQSANIRPRLAATMSQPCSSDHQENHTSQSSQMQTNISDKEMASMMFNAARIARWVGSGEAKAAFAKVSAEKRKKAGLNKRPTAESAETQSKKEASSYAQDLGNNDQVEPEQGASTGGVHIAERAEATNDADRGANATPTEQQAPSAKGSARFDDKESSEKPALDVDAACKNIMSLIGDCIATGDSIKKQQTTNQPKAMPAKSEESKATPTNSGESLSPSKAETAETRESEKLESAAENPPSRAIKNSSRIVIPPSAASSQVKIPNILRQPTYYQTSAKTQPKPPTPPAKSGDEKSKDMDGSAKMPPSNQKTHRGANSVGSRKPVTKPYYPIHPATLGVPDKAAANKFCDLQQAISAGLEVAREQFSIGTEFRTSWTDTARNSKYALTLVISHYQNLKLADREAPGAILTFKTLPPGRLVFSTDSAEPYRDSNWYSWSVPHQWLNSDQTTGKWCAPQYDGDEIPVTVSAKDGFLRGVSQDLRDVVAPIVRTLPHVYPDCSIKQEEFMAEFFIPTLDEFGLGEGGSFEFFDVSAHSMQHKRRVLTDPSGAPCDYWTASVFKNSMNYVQYISKEGYKSYSRARETKHVPIACAIVAK